MSRLQRLYQNFAQFTLIRLNKTRVLPIKMDLYNYIIPGVAKPFFAM